MGLLPRTALHSDSEHLQYVNFEEKVIPKRLEEEGERKELKESGERRKQEKVESQRISERKGPADGRRISFQQEYLVTDLNSRPTRGCHEVSCA
jgi:hypothetical protein